MLVIHGKLISQVTAIATSRFSAGEDMDVSIEDQGPTDMLIKMIQWYKCRLDWLEECVDFSS